ncbi:MAG: O-acetyl-ADP-ribose deacetylase [Porticoccaceae bacterium]|jgi:O-acetyl-ADP-ribose deacetylase (regulator of RNase III)|nr:O-acetyl-ADP-ribose deacetylase [Porticoccaceae bacterium]MEA3300364.1 O-acetyl-ADP-ribose deacetylase [Pseudomonadota bacterium]HLS97327.1 O-acetyl-ADP-ribose deacetylase [Porticoccaceae bacterium]
MAVLDVVEGDITRLAVDAVVNAANSRLAGGGGVDGAIHRAAGHDRLQAACRAIGHCPTGEVRVTPGFDLPARYIFHAVGPVWHGGQRGEAALLASCYQNALRLAGEYGVRTLAFPAISCGVYGYPPELAVPCALDAVLPFTAPPTVLERIVFCCFSPDMAALYRDALRQRGLPT